MIITINRYYEKIKKTLEQGKLTFSGWDIIFDILVEGGGAS